MGEHPRLRKGCVRHGIPYGISVVSYPMTEEKSDPAEAAANRDKHRLPLAMAADPADLEDFDVTAEALDRGQRARLIRKTRTDLGLSQSEFARRFRVPVGTLRDWEQARATAPDFAIAYVRVIGQHPDMVAKAVA
jgi:putative transcriptional regulator